MGWASCAVAGFCVMSFWSFLLKLVVGRPRGYVEIFNQASNPTTILAEMIAADLLKLGWKETLEPQTDRKSTRLTSSTNAHIVCRHLLENKKHTNQHNQLR